MIEQVARRSAESQIIAMAAAGTPEKTSPAASTAETAKTVIVTTAAASGSPATSAGVGRSFQKLTQANRFAYTKVY